MRKNRNSLKMDEEQHSPFYNKLYTFFKNNAPLNLLLDHVEKDDSFAGNNLIYHSLWEDEFESVILLLKLKKIPLYVAKPFEYQQEFKRNAFGLGSLYFTHYEPELQKEYPFYGNRETCLDVFYCKMLYQCLSIHLKVLSLKKIIQTFRLLVQNGDSLSFIDTQSHEMIAQWTTNHFWKYRISLYRRLHLDEEMEKFDGQCIFYQHFL